MSPNNTQGQHVVTAVIVAHDGAAWLPRMAEALLGQTRPVQRVVAVDTGSQDRSGAVLAGLLGRSVVFGMDRATGYGAAVSQALAHRAANTHVPGPAGLPQGDRVEWVWLLHDDCEPAPDALEQLLLGAAEARSAAVLGPKVMDWADRRVLLETGITIDGAGRRITGIEPREVDQGQHDGDRDVLAVGSAGMLVRRDAWDQVGGFDQGMTLFREDVDFCWRIHAAGYRVRVITDAVVYHLEAAARNRRVASAAPRPQRTDRQNALLTLLGNLPTWPAFVALASNLTLSVLRTIFFLLAKRPAAALDESAAFALVASHPLRVLSARRRRSQGRRAAYSRLRADLPRGRSLRRLAEFAASALSRSSQLDTAGSHHATDDPSDDDTLLVDTGFAQRILSNPGVLLFATLSVFAVVAERSLLGSGPLSGGALMPAWGGASGLWREYLQGFHPTAIGSAGATPPYVAVLATLASLLGGKPWLAVDVIMVGSVPLAGLAAFFAARRVTESVPARVWAGAAYALLPVGMGAVAAGRLGAAVAFTLIPLIGVLAARIFTQPRRRAKRAAWATGLLVTIAAAFVPLIWVVAVLAAGLAALAFGRSRRGILLDLGIVALVPPVLLMPWTLRVAAHPALAFLDAGHQVPGLASAHLSARSLLLLSPGGPGLPPYWVTAGLALAALAALLLTGRRTLVTVGWCVALLGLLLSIGVSRVLVTPDGGGPAIPAWPGISLAVAAAGLLLAATVAAGTVRARLADGQWRGVRGLGVALLALVACSAPLLAAGSWLVTGVRGPVGVSGGPVLPAFVSVSSDTGQRLRTLVLRPENGQLTYSVLRGADPLIGATELATPSAARQALDTAVATLVAPSGGDAQDQGQAMAAFDIGYVLLPAPVDARLARILDGVPTLRPVSETSAFQLWRVAETVARAWVIQPTGTVVPLAAGQTAVSARAPEAGGTLVLSEPAGSWTATLNGHPLTPLAAPVGGWAQGFRLPPGGGQLDITHNDIGRYLIVVLEAIAVLAVAALGLPGARNAAESIPEAAGEPGVGRRRGGRAKDHAQPGSQAPGSRAPGSQAPGSRDKASNRLGGRGLSRRAKNVTDGDPDPVRPGPGRPDSTARRPGEVGLRGPAPADQRDRAATGRRGSLAHLAPDASGGLADLAPDVRGGLADLGSGPDAYGTGADLVSGGRRGLDDPVRSPAELRGGRPDLAPGGRRGLDDRGSGLADARGGPADMRGGNPPMGRGVPPEGRGGAGAGRRGRPAGGRSAPADGRDVPVDGRGGAPWGEHEPPAERTGRPRLGHRSPAPADMSRPAPVDKRGPAPAGGRGSRPAERGSPVDGRGGVPWDEPQAPAGRPGHRSPVPEDSRGPVPPGSRGRLDSAGSGRRDERPSAASQPGLGRADLRNGTDRPDAGPADAKPASPRKGRLWGRRGRPSPQQRDEPAWDAGGLPRGEQSGRGQPDRGSPRGGSPRNGMPGGLPPGGGVPPGDHHRDGLPGGRPATDRPAADRPATGRPAADRPVGSSHSRPGGDRRGTPRPPRPDRAPVTRGRLPGDDEALPPLGSLAPLAPLPPPLPRSAAAPSEDGYPDPDGVPASWRSDAPQDPGEVDW